METIVFFDTETTGLPKNWKGSITDTSNWPRIIQLAWCVCNAETGEVLSDREYLIRPDGWEIPKEKFWIDNGFSTEENARLGVDMAFAIQEISKDLINCSLLVAHNMDYDYPVTVCEFLRYDINLGKKLNKFCTMKSTTSLLMLPGPYGFKFPKLQELHRWLFDEDFENAHQASADKEICRKCFFELRKRNLICLNTTSS